MRSSVRSRLAPPIFSITCRVFSPFAFIEKSLDVERFGTWAGLGVFFLVARRKIEVQGSGLQCRLHGFSACQRRESLHRSPLLSFCKGATGCVPPIARSGLSNLFPGRNIRTRAT